MDPDDVQWDKHGSNAVLVFLLLLAYQYVFTTVRPGFLVAGAVVYFLVLVGFDLLKSARGWGDDE